MKGLLQRVSLFRTRVVPTSFLFFQNNNNNNNNTLLVSSSSPPTRIIQFPLWSNSIRYLSSTAITSERRKEGGWFNKRPPNIVKAGDPVLHEPAREVEPNEIKSERVQNIIDDMIRVMRKAPGVGLAAPQIGIPLKIIVLEDTEEYISYDKEEEVKAQDRKPFDLLVILNPKLKKKKNRTALFFEGCLRSNNEQWICEVQTCAFVSVSSSMHDGVFKSSKAKGEVERMEFGNLAQLHCPDGPLSISIGREVNVDGFMAVVERYLDVEVEGFDRDGEPIKINASGWQARILQHECDHLDGTLYVDRMVPRTFRTSKNIDLPLAHVCPKLGPR
ncbi:hypothetical protein Lal_00045601 [Lupinus albus]|nr:hypothetical protein Lal_00045601 [Lupinus albus]